MNSDDAAFEFNNPPAPIIIIYLSKALPNYVIQSILNCTERFPERNTILVTNARVPRKLVSVNNFHLVQLLNQGDSLDKSENLGLSHNLAFRNGFWYRTIERFFVLERVMIQLDIVKALHIEADVWLSSNFPFRELETNVRGLAYPGVDEARSSGAVFFVGERKSLATFLEFIPRAVKNNSKATDMTLLKNFADSFPALYQEMPTNIVDTNINSTRVELVQGIFDAAPWGQFLFGLDPSISAGKHELFRDLAQYVIKPSRAHLSVDSNSVIHGFMNNKKFSIYNLHIHSKDKRIFKYRGNRLNGYLVEIICKSRKGPQSRFSLRGFQRWLEINLVLLLKYSIKSLKKVQR